MPAISINSLIANLKPGRITSSSPPSASSPASVPSTDHSSGVVFTQGEPWRNQAGGATQVGYTRRDAMGSAQRGSDVSSTGAVSQAGAPADPGAADAGQGKAAKTDATPDAIKKPSGEPLSKAEMAVLRELQKADQAVKAHELAHLAAAGGYAKGGATYSYQQGPDGQSYAVGGEVQVDTSKEATPEATIQKMQVIRQAALAPVDPSAQDQLVAAHATLQISESSKELMQLQQAQATKSQAPASQEGKADEGTARGIYQGAASGLVGRTSSPADSLSRAQKAYAAYSQPFALSASSDRQGLDRVV
jgi:hypothetical protein